MTSYDQLTVSFSIALALMLFAYYEFTAHFRIMRRPYIDEIEYKALTSDQTIAELTLRLNKLLEARVIQEEKVAPGVKQLSFDLPLEEAKTMRFPITLLDPEGNVCIKYVVAKREDWAKWKAGLHYVKRRNKFMWTEDVWTNDRIPILRRIGWSKRINNWDFKEMLVYPNEFKPETDYELGPFAWEE